MRERAKHGSINPPRDHCIEIFLSMVRRKPCLPSGCVAGDLVWRAMREQAEEPDCVEVLAAGLSALS